MGGLDILGKVVQLGNKMCAHICDKNGYNLWNSMAVMKHIYSLNVPRKGPSTSFPGRGS